MAVHLSFSLVFRYYLLSVLAMFLIISWTHKKRLNVVKMFAARAKGFYRAYLSLQLDLSLFHISGRPRCSAESGGFHAWMVLLVSVVLGLYNLILDSFVVSWFFSFGSCQVHQFSAIIFPYLFVQSLFHYYFLCGRFIDPVTSGDYPFTMRDSLGDCLLKFTEQQSQQLKGSFDFLGMNYYTSRYATNCLNPTNLNPGTNRDCGANLICKASSFTIALFCSLVTN